MQAHGAIYGTKDAGKVWYLYLRGKLKGLGLIESRLEKGLYGWRLRGELVCLAHTHVDDLLVAGKQIPKVENMLAKAVKELHLKQSADSFIYCGRTITITRDAILISMAASCRDCGPNLTLSAERRKQTDSPCDGRREIRVSCVARQAAVVYSELPSRLCVRGEQDGTEDREGNCCRSH